MGNIINTYNSFPNKSLFTSIPNLIVWLDGTSITDGTNIITTSGQPVVNWKNKVTNEILGANQLTSNRQPMSSIVGGKMEVQFTTNDYLALTDSPLIDFQPNSEYSIIILTGSNTTTSGTLIEKGDSNNRQYGLMWYYSGGQQITSFVYDNQYQGSPVLLQSPQVVSMITKTDNNFKVLVNNVLGHTNTVLSPTTPFSGYKALIGGRDGVGVSESNVGYFLTGALRTVLIYNRALTDEEHLLIYNELML